MLGNDAIHRRGGVTDPEGGKIVTTSYDNTAKVWDARKGDLLGDLTGYLIPLDAVFSPDGTRALTRASFPLRISVWDLTENEIVTLQLENTAYQAAWSPDGKSILVCEGNVARLYGSIPWPELAQLGGEAASLDDRIRLWHEQQRN